MPYIDVTRLIDDCDPFDFSASKAERGQNAGPETWNNAVTEATERPLEIDDPDGIRAWLKAFGAWEKEEIAKWSDAELGALVLQYAAGDLRELQSLHPGDGIGGIDWEAAEDDIQEGLVGGSIYPGDDGRLYVYLEA